MKRFYISAIFLSFCCATYSAPPKCADKVSINQVKDVFIRSLIGHGAPVAIGSDLAKNEAEYAATLDKRISKLRTLVQIDSITSDGLDANSNKRMCSAEVIVPGDDYTARLRARYSLQSFESGNGFKAAADFTSDFTGREAFNIRGGLQRFFLTNLYMNELEARERAASAASAARAASATAPQDPQ